ncbi:aminodeoxychorismate synthase component I [Tropicibacter naphthalenivorans]|uniref:Para-aminobenzoate synthase component 1 n=1 Tax=Tropicibacter naphthalenivorans TaxID=441103 RepID=A0A0N7M0Q8_9RHOB|nr:aminodeoxychorismate synthase component I [Tropicibacter naphthalenivorans]CUH81145.1 Para-aminobenzoate synthase component 1 [Tropicibacter naphthalenivorans]SMC97391.1 aminodeoxychorismate synthase, subunit I [Tropicibacter naphthalenivorans]
MRIRFDNGPGGNASGFDHPIRLIEAHTPQEVPAAFAALETAKASGHWLAGYASYELGYVLEPRLAALMPVQRRMPLLSFGVYDAPQQPAPLGGDGFELGEFIPDWDSARYAQAFDAVRDHIGAGDIYQANLTMPLRATFKGDPRGLYAALARRQPVAHGALIEPAEGPAILSRSPELFFRVDADGTIATRPMKGTAPRGATPAEDTKLRDALTQDEKTLAENLMIVDLLRNDLSRIAQPGSVRVPELFKVETYETVHQVVSQVEAQLATGTGLADILTAIFPCGSITGAPKIRSMQIIRALEQHPREAYCGAIGWAAPDGRASFNVAIRTLLVENGQAVLNVGGGLVWDSRADSEYEEALWKSRFATFQPEPA